MRGVGFPREEKSDCLKSNRSGKGQATTRRQGTGLSLLLPCLSLTSYIPRPSCTGLSLS